MDKVKFKELLFLDLHKNSIENIDVFKKVEFSHLNALDLNNNNITNIDCFGNIEHFKLNKLYLDGNDNIDKDKHEKIIAKIKDKVNDFKI